MILGKFLHGVTVTVVFIAGSKMISESVPVYMLGTFGPFNTVSMSSGFMLVLGFGLLLPSGDYNPSLQDDPKNLQAKQANIDDEMWRFVYSFPVIINCINLICFCLFIKEDSVMFNLSKFYDEPALALIDKIYHPSCDR